MARRCSRLCVSCTSHCPMSAHGEVLIACPFLPAITEPSTWAALGSGTSPQDVAWGCWLLLLPCCPGLKHKEFKSRPGQMGCGPGEGAEINMPQMIVTSRVMERGASGGSRASSNCDRFALPHPYCVPSTVSWALHGARHLLSAPPGIHGWRMRTTHGLFSPQAAEGQ